LSNSSLKNVRFTGLALAATAILGTSVAVCGAIPNTDESVLVHDTVAVPEPGFPAELGQPSHIPLQTEIILAFSDGATNSIVNRLQGGVAECGGLPVEYRADCMAQTYRGAASLASRSDYAQARTELSRTSRSLSGLVAQNADPAAQPLRKGGKTFRAVKASAARAVNSKAVAIISEAETKLLRSANSGLRKVHFQRIAQAVGSTKTIFRS
jgi:hypothetical protein